MCRTYVVCSMGGALGCNFPACASGRSCAKKGGRVSEGTRSSAEYLLADSDSVNKPKRMHRRTTLRDQSPERSQL